MLPCARLQATAFRADLQDIIFPSTGNVHRKFAAVLKQIPSSIGIVLIHAGHDPGKGAIAGWTHPSSVTKRLILLKVALVAQIKCRRRRQYRRRSNPAVRLPYDFTRGLERHALATNRPNLIARAFGQQRMRHQSVRIDVRTGIVHPRCRHPLFKNRRCRFPSIRQPLLLVSQLTRQGCPTLFVLGRLRYNNIRIRPLTVVAVKSRLRRIPEKCRHRIKIFGCDRIEFVIMTHRAVGGQPEENPRRRLCSIAGVIG